MATNASSESFAATFSPFPSEPLMSPPNSREARLSGSGSCCGTLSLAYNRRQSAIATPMSQIAGLLDDKGNGVRMLDLARGVIISGPKGEGIRIDLSSLKGSPQTSDCLLAGPEVFCSRRGRNMAKRLYSAFLA